MDELPWKTQRKIKSCGNQNYCFIGGNFITTKIYKQESFEVSVEIKENLSRCRDMRNQSERRISCLGFPWNRSNNFPSYVYSIKSFSLHMSKDYNAKCMELLLFWEEMMEKSVADTYTIRIFVHIVSRSLWGQVGVRNCIDLYV